MNVKFNSDDVLLLNKMKEIPSMIVVKLFFMKISIGDIIIKISLYTGSLR